MTTAAEATAHGELADLYDRWFASFETKNYAFWDEVLADDWVYTDFRGQVRGKGEYREMVSQLDLTDHFHRMYELRVRLVGDVAIVHGHYEVGGKLLDGRDVSADTRFTANWIRRDGRWQCLMHHATKIDPEVAAQAG